MLLARRCLLSVRGSTNLPSPSCSRKLERVWIKTTTTVKKLFGVYRYTCILINLPSNVDKLKLDTNIVSAVSTGSSASQVSVEVSASDPENDVLTFNYFVSAGAIKGVGSKVI